MLHWKVSVEPMTESNCYILIEDGHCVIIDPGESENLLRLLAENKLEPELILLTHEHCDHMGGLDVVREQYPKARFAATALCDKGIQNVRLNLSRVMDVYLYFRGKEAVGYQPFTYRAADEIIAPDAVLQWRGHTLRFVSLPGHTAGSSGIFADEEIFFSGDYLIPEEEPVLRFPGGNEKVFREVTEPFLRSLPKGLQVCPGHGEAFFLV